MTPRLIAPKIPGKNERAASRIGLAALFTSCAGSPSAVPVGGCLSWLNLVKGFARFVSAVMAARLIGGKVQGIDVASDAPKVGPVVDFLSVVALIGGGGSCQVCFGRLSDRFRRHDVGDCLPVEIPTRRAFRLAVVMSSNALTST